MFGYNDDLLIYYIHLNNKFAYDFMYNKYSSIVEVLLRKNLNFNVIDHEDYDDMKQESLAHINKVIYSYRNEEGTFYMYFQQAVLNIIYTHMKIINRRNSRNVYECDYDSKDANIFAYLSDSVLIDCEYEYHEARKYLENQCKNDLERNIVSLKKRGYSYQEISEILNIKTKKVDYVLSNLKKNYKKMFD